MCKPLKKQIGFFGLLITAILLGQSLMAQEIFDAAEKGDLAEIKRLFEEGIDLNTISGSSEYHYSVLHIAANKGYLELAEWLVSNGAEVNITSDAGITPLHMAARKGYPEITELLIANGADINANEFGIGTPLHEAASAGKMEILEILISNGADVNIIAEYDETPLTLAVAGGHDDIIELLVKSGANVNAKNSNGIGYVKEEQILPQREYWFTSERELIEEELRKYSKTDLKIMRNEIFAAHGYIFKTSAMKEYFSSKKWYIPRFDNVDKKLTEIEKKNIDLIRKVEAQ